VAANCVCWFGGTAVPNAFSEVDDGERAILKQAPRSHLLIVMRIVCARIDSLCEDVLCEEMNGILAVSTRRPFELH
jgi:hypothetical protein